jgi:hypothetical protein
LPSDTLDAGENLDGEKLSNFVKFDVKNSVFAVPQFVYFLMRQPCEIYAR